MNDPIPTGPAHHVHWFSPPDRPVEGGTVFVRPDGEIDTADTSDNSEGEKP